MCKELLRFGLLKIFTLLRVYLLFNVCQIQNIYPCVHEINNKEEQTSKLNSVEAKLRYMGYFAIFLHPQEEKDGYYFQSGTCLGALETHVLLSFLWSFFVNGL